MIDHVDASDACRAHSHIAPAWFATLRPAQGDMLEQRSRQHTQADIVISYADTMAERDNSAHRTPLPRSAGRYVARGIPGRGGMGEVRIVEARVSGRDIGSKVLAPARSPCSDAHALVL